MSLSLVRGVPSVALAEAAAERRRLVLQNAPQHAVVRV